MTDEETVRTRFPNATARPFRVAYLRGEARPAPELWTIYRTESLGVNNLGSGPSEAEAWASAAAGLPPPK